MHEIHGYQVAGNIDLGDLIKAVALLDHAIGLENQDVLLVAVQDALDQNIITSYLVEQLEANGWKVETAE